MSKIAINTSQNVNIHFELASVGDRMVAFFIDMVIKSAYLVCLYILIRLMSINNPISNINKEWDQWEVMAVIGIVTLPIHIYTLVCESLMEGQTFGKKIMQIKVVKIDGYQASFGDYLMRWLFRIIDIVTNGGVVGLLAIILSKNNQRLGGMVSGTAVISLKSKINISHTILENITEDYTPTYPQVILLSDNDMRIIKENYKKAIVSFDNQMISRLANKIKEILKIEINHQEITEKQFIDTIIKDYNFYTGKQD